MAAFDSSRTDVIFCIKNSVIYWIASMLILFRLQSLKSSEWYVKKNEILPATRMVWPNRYH